MKKNKSKTKLRYKCPDCGSVVHRDIVEGVVMEYCSNDALPDYADYFQWFQKQGAALQASLMMQWDDLKHSLYGQWFLATQDPDSPFICDWKIDPRARLFTPSKCIVTFPDTAQVMIAEAILNRPLTEQELTGARNIPIIDEEGAPGEERIDMVRYPVDVAPKYKDMTEVYNPDRSPVVFKWEDL